MNPKETPIEYSGQLQKWRGRFLPHWHIDQGIFFVTYSLRDAVAPHKLEALSKERERRLQELERAGKLTADNVRDVDDEILMELDEVFDQGSGSQLLREPAAAKIVADAFEYFDGERYDLISWVIMPTHIHAALRALGTWRMDKIVGSWKSFTAKEIIKALGLTQDHVWQSDYYDRIVWTVEELERVRKYIWENPNAAGLENWTWRREYEFGLL